jgi:hypothetical protein
MAASSSAPISTCASGRTGWRAMRPASIDAVTAASTSPPPLRIPISRQRSQPSTDGASISTIRCTAGSAHASSHASTPRASSSSGSATSDSSTPMRCISAASSASKTARKRSPLSLNWW